MDYKKFEENVYKYIIEYNKGSTKSITRVKKAKETLNITDKQLSDIILSFDNLLRKNIYKYSYNKKLEVIKFNLLSKYWKINIIALGGIKSGNIKKISLTNTVGFGGISFFED